jgi:hypothetical protein
MQVQFLQSYIRKFHVIRMVGLIFLKVYTCKDKKKLPGNRRYDTNTHAA